MHTHVHMCAHIHVYMPHKKSLKSKRIDYSLYFDLAITITQVPESSRVSPGNYVIEL